MMEESIAMCIKQLRMAYFWFSLILRIAAPFMFILTHSLQSIVDHSEDLKNVQIFLAVQRVDNCFLSQI